LGYNREKEDGDTPKCFLKALLKVKISANPIAMATSETAKSDFNNFDAVFNRTVRMYL
jgi:hypothetical protein